MAQYPSTGFPPDSQVVLLRKLVRNTADMAGAFPAGIIPGFVAVPASSAAPGAAGNIAVDASYLYVYSAAAGGWRRVAIDDWA